MVHAHVERVTQIVLGQMLIAESFFLRPFSRMLGRHSKPVLAGHPNIVLVGQVLAVAV